MRIQTQRFYACAQSGYMSKLDILMKKYLLVPVILQANGEFETTNSAHF